MLYRNTFNSLPKYKFLDWSKLKTFAENETDGSERQIFMGRWVENIAGKGENAGYWQVSFSHKVSKRLLFQGH